jgi:hypothetical protein
MSAIVNNKLSAKADFTGRSSNFPADAQRTLQLRNNIENPGAYLGSAELNNSL